MKVLLIDDETAKRERVRQLIEESFHAAVVTEASSYQSAMSALRGEAIFDVVVLDMRLTTYDVSSHEAGGRPRNFGGEEILRKMARRGLETPVVVLTQYTVFSDENRFIDGQSLARRLESLGAKFRGLIHFGHSDESWKLQLRGALLSLQSEQPESEDE